MTATVDQICDDIATALGEVDFSSWGYDETVSIVAISMPIFDALEAVDVTKIAVSAYPNIESEIIDRASIGQKHKIGIAIIRKIKMEDGIPDETEFRKLKSLAESIIQWVWDGVPGLEHKAIEVNFPAWFDFERAKNGIFLTTINPVYLLGFSR